MDFDYDDINTFLAGRMNVGIDQTLWDYIQKLDQDPSGQAAEREDPPQKSAEGRRLTVTSCTKPRLNSLPKNRLFRAIVQKPPPTSPQRTSFRADFPEKRPQNALSV